MNVRYMSFQNIKKNKKKTNKKTKTKTKKPWFKPERHFYIFEYILSPSKLFTFPEFLLVQCTSKLLNYPLTNL